MSSKEEIQKLIKEKEKLEKKIRDAKSAIEIPPKPEYPELKPYPLNEVEGEVDLHFPDEMLVEDFFKFVSYAIKVNFPKAKMSDIKICKQYPFYEEVSDRFVLKYDAGKEEKQKHYQILREIDKENKKLKDKYNRQTREWYKLYG